MGTHGNRASGQIALLIFLPKIKIHKSGVISPSPSAPWSRRSRPGAPGGSWRPPAGRPPPPSSRPAGGSAGPAHSPRRSCLTEGNTPAGLEKHIKKEFQHCNQCCGSGSVLDPYSRIRIHTCKYRIKWRQKMSDLIY